AEVRFRVTDESGNPLENVTVNNWIYSTITDKDGFTEWIEVLPTITVNEPYIAKAEFLDEVLWSKPFLIENDEKKTIHIVHRGSK
ncbi:MAG: carboxypeptidase regulatory-like domain-containing protein, partial [Nitrosarchaeum sp.]|nr:carboxypeptidase regulatory-like domain-containing protein [Nitrosarchaeum sp.]